MDKSIDIKQLNTDLNLLLFLTLEYMEAKVTHPDCPIFTQSFFEKEEFEELLQDELFAKMLELKQEIATLKSNIYGSYSLMLYAENKEIV